jgi:hypothetical protein
MFPLKLLEYENEQCFIRSPSRDVITETGLEVKSVERELPLRENLSMEADK